MTISASESAVGCAPGGIGRCRVAAGQPHDAGTETGTSAIESFPWYAETVQSAWLTQPAVRPAVAPVERTGRFHRLELLKGRGDCTDGADVVGGDVVGADVVGADVVGADVVGADVVGTDAFGEITTVGADVGGTDELGETATTGGDVFRRETLGPSEVTCSSGLETRASSADARYCGWRMCGPSATASTGAVIVAAVPVERTVTSPSEPPRRGVAARVEESSNATPDAESTTATAAAASRVGCKPRMRSPSARGTPTLRLGSPPRAPYVAMISTAAEVDAPAGTCDTGGATTPETAGSNVTSLPSDVPT